MLYHSSDGNILKIIKLVIFWLSIASMTALFIFLLNNEVELPQRKIKIAIDAKNKINICEPEDKENARFDKLNNKF